MEQEPEGGILKWAEGLDVTILECRVERVIYRPPTPPPDKESKP